MILTNIHYVDFSATYQRDFYVCLGLEYLLHISEKLLLPNFCFICPIFCMVKSDKIRKKIYSVGHQKQAIFQQNAVYNQKGMSV